ncbi:cytochrome b5-like heme/steroid binding domain-containing protein [Trichoderma evansii]
MSGRFEPKVPVQLDPPKSDPISVDDLAKANGTNGEKSYVAIKGKVYDVSGNKMYQPGGSYHVFAGKDASRALGMTSVKPEDVRPDWHDLPDKEKGVLEDWITFFSKRYNVVGVVEGANNQ